jgi:hypothetical protein
MVLGRRFRHVVLRMVALPVYSLSRQRERQCSAANGCGEKTEGVNGRHQKGEQLSTRPSRNFAVTRE